MSLVPLKFSQIDRRPLELLDIRELFKYRVNLQQLPASAIPAGLPLQCITKQASRLDSRP